MRDMVALLGAEVPSGRTVARKIRSERYACRMLTSDTTADRVAALLPRGIVLAGEAGEGAHAPDPALLQIGVPVLALGSAATALLSQVGRREEESPLVDTVRTVRYKDARLFDALDASERWILRAERFQVDLPYRVIADSEGMPIAYGDDASNVFLLQFPIERNDLDGSTLLRTFVADICGCEAWWTQENIIAACKERISEAAQDGQVVCALSGGLDSTVAAVLARSAVGDERMRCLFVDTGLLREGEAEETVRYVSRSLGMNLQRIDMSGRILSALAGVEKMKEKQRVVDGEIKRVLREEAETCGCNTVFVTGTNLMDILCCHDAEMIVHDDTPTVRPLRDLFKEEIRSIGETFGLAGDLLYRQPFPGMGLAARIDGAVTSDKLRMLQQAGGIFAQEMKAAGQDRRTERYFAMFNAFGETPVIILRALQGDEPNMVVARLPNDLLGRCVQRIRLALGSDTHVLYDMTPGLAEWPF